MTVVVLQVLEVEELVKLVADFVVEVLDVLLVVLLVVLEELMVAAFVDEVLEEDGVEEDFDEVKEVNEADFVDEDVVEVLDKDKVEENFEEVEERVEVDFELEEVKLNLVEDDNIVTGTDVKVELLLTLVVSKVLKEVKLGDTDVDETNWLEELVEVPAAVLRVLGGID